MSRQTGYFETGMPHYGVDRLDFYSERLRLFGPGARVVDIGCGDGTLLKEISAEHPHLSLLGLDPATRYVDRFDDIDIKVVHGSLLEPEGLENVSGADLYLLVMVLHHLVTSSYRGSETLALEGLKTIARWMGDESTLLVIEDCHGPRWAAKLIYWIKELVTRALGQRRVSSWWFNPGAPVVAFNTPERFTEMFREAGFRILRRELLMSKTLGGFIRRERVAFELELDRSPA